MISSQHLRGVLYLIAGVTFFGMVDGLSKVIITELSVGQVMFARCALALPALLVATGPARWSALFATRQPGLQILRGLSPVAIGGAMVLGVKFLPLAETTVILFAGPFLVVALSGPLLGERVGLASWIGVAIGFAAVLMVARPGLGALSVYTLFPAAAAVFYAAFQLLTGRLGSTGESVSAIASWTLAIGFVVTAPLAILDWRPMSGFAWLVFAGIGATFAAAHFLTAKAFVLTPANVLAPISYFQIVSVVIFGFVVFRELPDLVTVLGIIMIIAAGIYVSGWGRKGAG